MRRRKSGHRVLSTIAGLGLLFAGMPVIAAESTGARHSGDPCGEQLQQVRADLAKKPTVDANMRAQVNEASVFCQQGEPEEAQKILDQVARDLRTPSRIRIN
ncbi:MAG: hypothetical protein HOJ90_11930 [Alphaproteobacteria bacterium]|jgi:hypothetical protein|nr:hypothetical protein [Alphaproteobacteria bacterium]